MLKLICFTLAKETTVYQILTDTNQHNMLFQKRTICKKHKAPRILIYLLREHAWEQDTVSCTTDGRATQLQINRGENACYIKEALVGFKLAVSSILGPIPLSGNDTPTLYLNLNLLGLKNITHHFPTWCFFSHMYCNVTYSTHSTEQSLDPNAERILLIKK